MLFVHAAALHAQNPHMDALRKVLAENCVIMEADFQLSMSQTRMTGKAFIEAQGDAYVMKTETMDVYCDGESIWTVDASSKEVYVEAAVSGGQQGLDAALMALMDSDEVDCTFSEDGRLTGMSLSLPDGISVTATILSFEAVNKKSVTSFRPQSEFGSDWIVTDLR